jgi:hypothetical protein
MIEIGAVATDNTNITAGTNASTTTIDHSYSRFPVQTAGDDNVPTMSFGDFLDMINPLQHIPVMSSIYRAETGNTINPVSRIAGDALYSGVLGVASAGIAAIGAIGDEIFTAANDGKSASSTIMSALFGSSTERATQLASANTDASPSAAQTQVALLQTPAKQTPIISVPDLSRATSQIASTSAPQTPASTNTSIVPATPTLASAAGSGLPIDRSKPVYGGVMDSAMLQNAQQNQALALAMAGGRNTMQEQHDIRNNRFATSNNAASSTSGSNNAPPTAVSSMPTLQAAAIQNQIANSPALQPGTSMQSLIQSLQSMKGVNQYKSTAQQSFPAMGSSVDLTN